MVRTAGNTSPREDSTMLTSVARFNVGITYESLLVPAVSGCQPQSRPLQSLIPAGFGHTRQPLRGGYNALEYLSNSTGVVPRKEPCPSAGNTAALPPAKELEKMLTPARSAGPHTLYSSGAKGSKRSRRTHNPATILPKGKAKPLGSGFQLLGSGSQLPGATRINNSHQHARGKGDSRRGDESSNDVQKALRVAHPRGSKEHPVNSCQWTNLGQRSHEIMSTHTLQAQGRRSTAAFPEKIKVHRECRPGGKSKNIAPYARGTKVIGKADRGDCQHPGTSMFQKGLPQNLRQVVKEEKLQEGDFEVESLMSFGGSHCPNRSTWSPKHRSLTSTESTASCNAVRILTHEEFTAKHPHPLSPDNVRIARRDDTSIDRPGESTIARQGDTSIDRQPPAPIDRRAPITYRVQVPKIDVARLNALRPKPKPSENAPETVRIPSDDGGDSMEVDRVPMGRTLRKRKEKVEKHLKRGPMIRKRKVSERESSGFL
ncbi:hypothetical protein DY000_02049539 [Brassica cretica]|uniref:DUF3741 domain-containing protein n=1 Tax=Brassica cretica TaxID=69181 RepID=A0ABQ7ETD2_BRACR|nr:hypothetical protein DY000_02049539 [Brassica cretica]